MAHTPSREPAVGGHSPAADVVREALGAIAAPPVATRVLHRALHLAGETEIPRGGSRLRRFVERHLHAATSFILGATLADELRAQLAPLVEPLPSVEPKRRGRALLELEAAGLVDPSEALEARPPSAELTLELDEDEGELEVEPHPMATRRTERAPLKAVILVASTDGSAVETMREVLRVDAIVVQVIDVVALLDAVQHHGEEATTCVLIDGAAASVHPATLATIADDLPLHTALASWRVAAHEHPDSLLPLGPAEAPRIWLELPAHLDARGAADELRRVLGLPASGIFAARPR